MLFRSNPQLIVEGVVPDLLHVVPVGHDSVLNGVLQGKNSTLVLSFISHVSILLIHANHDARVLGTANDTRENGPGGVISRESSLVAGLRAAAAAVLGGCFV